MNKIALGLALAAAGAALAIGAGTTRAAPATTMATTQPITTVAGVTVLTPEAIYQADAPSVVVITATETQTIPRTPVTPALTAKVTVLGSGFVIDGQGDILTNDHVVQGGTGIRVAFSSGASYPATVVGADPSSDIAVVHVQAPASLLLPLAFGDSTAVAVGDPAYAIGNPFGLDRTMTAGIISATGRDIQAPNGRTIPNAIQTDAAINHGNSGGPLLDQYGHVVGVNDQIEGGGVNGNVGVGFAISSNRALFVANQLIATGTTLHGLLGVQAETITSSAAKVAHSLPSHGVVVAGVVKGGPAAKAGLRAATRKITVNGVSAQLGGDAIVSVDGARIDSVQQLAKAIAVRRPGDRVTLRVVRARRSRSVSVVLGSG